MAALGVDGGKLRALLALRARITWRQFSGERGRLVSLVIAFLVGLPLVLVAAAGSALGYTRLPRPFAVELLGIVMVALWVAWLLLPVLVFNVNEAMDVTRLLVYPLTRRELIGAMVLGTLFDFPTYVMLPLFVAILIGWALNPGLPLVLLALVLAYGHMVLASQIVVTAAGGVLRSRRFRDVFVVLTALVGFSCYFLQRAAYALFTRYVDAEQVTSLRPLVVLQWLPPGAAARAISLAAEGSWLPALAWLAYLTLTLLAIAWVWWRLSVRVLTGEGFLLQWGGRETAAMAPQQRTALEGGAGWLPYRWRQLLGRELKLVWRTPQRRVSLLQGGLLPLFMLLFIFFGDEGVRGLPRWIGLTVPLYAMFSTFITAQNGLGWEGRGLPTLLLTPLPRRELLLAKGIVLSGLSFMPIAALIVVVLVLTPGWLPVAGSVVAVGATLAAVAVSLVTAVYFPFPVNPESRSFRGSASRSRGGCLTGLANGFLVPGLIGVACMPLLAGLALGWWLELPWLALGSGVLGLAYGAVLLWLASGWAGRALLRREPEVLAATRLPETT